MFVSYMYIIHREMLAQQSQLLEQQQQVSHRLSYSYDIPPSQLQSQNNLHPRHDQRSKPQMKADAYDNSKSTYALRDSGGDQYTKKNASSSSDHSNHVKFAQESNTSNVTRSSSSSGSSGNDNGRYAYNNDVESPEVVSEGMAVMQERVRELEEQLLERERLIASLEASPPQAYSPHYASLSTLNPSYYPQQSPPSSPTAPPVASKVRPTRAQSQQQRQDPQQEVGSERDSDLYAPNALIPTPSLTPKKGSDLYKNTEVVDGVRTLLTTIGQNYDPPAVDRPHSPSRAVVSIIPSGSGGQNYDDQPSSSTRDATDHIDPITKLRRSIGKSLSLSHHSFSATLPNDLPTQIHPSLANSSTSQHSPYRSTSPTTHTPYTPHTPHYTETLNKNALIVLAEDAVELSLPRIINLNQVYIYVHTYIFIIRILYVCITLFYVCIIL